MFSTLFGWKKKWTGSSTVELTPTAENGWDQLRVKLHNGRITVTQWEHPHLEAKVEVTVRGNMADDLTEQDVGRFWELEENGGTVRLEQIKWLNLTSFVRVNVELKVPKQLDAKVTTHNGEIDLADCEGLLEALTHNGAVTLRRHTGDVNLHSHNGKVTVEDLQGNLEASTHNGQLNFARVEGRIQGETHNGRIWLQDCNNTLDLMTHNGKIEVENREAKAGDWEMVTHRGNIALTLPRETDAHLKLRTAMGKIKGDLLNLQLSGVSQKLQATLGQGGPHVRLSTSCGNIELKAPV